MPAGMNRADKNQAGKDPSGEAGGIAGQGSGRRRGRVLAMKLLYQAEMAGGVPDISRGSSSLEEFGEAPERAREFALELARGVVGKRAELDAAVGEVMQKWDPGRLAAVDAQLLRVAAYELLFCPDIPGRVSINEALEIGREYSTAESVKFMNGVLDALAQKKAPEKLKG